MEDSQRQAMYDGWARGKKWMKISILEDFSNGTWVACAEDKFGCIERPTRITAIQKMQGMLAERGYEISNMAELMGITPPEGTPYMSVEESMKPMKRTFIEWLRFIERAREKRDMYDELVRRNGNPPYTII